jgi:hypothetical protein
MRRHRILGRQDVLHPYYKLILNEAISLGYTVPSLNQQLAQSLLLSNIVANGIWGEFDLIYIFQNDCGLDFGKLNWKSPTQYRLSFPYTYPMWHKNLGWTGRPDLAEANAYIDTGYTPSVHGVTWSDNDMGVWFASSSGYLGAGYSCWSESVNNVNRTATYLFDANMGHAVNGINAAFALSGGQYLGLYGAERLLASSHRLTHNGAGIFTGVTAGGGRSANPLRLFGIDLPQAYPLSYLGPNFPVQCFFAGSAVSGAQQVILSTHLAQYQASLFTLFVSGTVGAANYTVPAGVNQLLVECWGGGGAGRGYTNVVATTTGAGGGGGGYSASVVNVTPGQIIPYVVGASGVGNTGQGSAGGDTSWNGGQILAKGGSAGTGTAGFNAPGGQASAGVGDVKYSGGNGGFQGAALTGYGTASGGSGAGSLQNGINGINGTNGQTAAWRSGRALLGGGSPGLSQSNVYNGTGSHGFWSAGGGGARRTTVAPLGGNGGTGYIRITVNKFT